MADGLDFNALIAHAIFVFICCMFLVNQCSMNRNPQERK
jgi:hypothetical protein